MGQRPESITSLSEVAQWSFHGPGVLITLIRKPHGWEVTCDPYFHSCRLYARDFETARIEALQLIRWAFDRASRVVQAELERHTNAGG